MEQDEASPYLNDNTYTAISFRGHNDTERYLVYSKDEDSLPIVSTAVEPDIPCVRPDERTDIVNDRLYPLENELFMDFCQYDQNIGLKQDPRFYWTGGKVTELEV